MNLPILTSPDATTVQNFFFPVFWGSTDRETVTSLAKAVTERVQPGFHFADNFLTWGRNNSMFEDGPFVDYLGGTAFPRTFWGYDLFEHSPDMEHHSMADHGPGLAEIVRAKFAGYP